MKKKIFIAIYLILSLTACGSGKTIADLASTGYKNLYYDTTTNIVYYVTQC